MNWIEELKLCRMTLYSTVILVITDDCKRDKELLNEIRKKWIIDKDETLYIYDGWRGLSKIAEDGKPEAVTADKNPLTAIMGTSKMPLPQALNAMDEKLKENPTVFVIKNVIEEDKTLNTAILSWASDDMIFTKKSTIILVAQGKNILPETIRDQVSIVEPPSSTAEERAGIIKALAKEFNKKPNIEEIVNLTGGLNLNQLEAAVIESIAKTSNITPAMIATMKARLISRREVLSVMMDPKHGFERVGGYQALKDFITTSIVDVYKNRKLAETLKIPFPRGFILFGMGGTGKTILAKATAKECNLPFVNLRVENIKRGIVGESEERMSQALRTINEMSPCIVFIDEIDRLGTRNDISTDSGTSRELFSQLLEWLGDEDRKAIVIGTTNLPDALDDAFRRVGRFDYLIPMLLPPLEAREAILKVHTDIKTRVPLDSNDPPNFDVIAEETEGWNGAEIEELIHRSKRKAFNAGADHVSNTHFLEAFNTFSVNTDERKEEMQHFMELAKDMTNDTTFLKKIEDGYKRQVVKTKAQILKEAA